MKTYHRESDGLEIQDALDRDLVWITATYGEGFIEVISPGPTAEDLCKEKCKEIDTYCAGKFTVGFSYGGAIFQACGESQRLISGRVSRALANKIDAVTFPWVAPYSDGWWDVNNVILASTMTVDGFLAFAKAFGDYCSACDKCKRDHKSAITTENCATYDYTTGWPVNP